MPEAILSASIVNSVAEIPAAVWNGLAPSHAAVVDNPFVDHAFFLAAEQSGSSTRRTG
ncbi:MAG: GNAT family N-acetyltransferase, partial [Alphaproteobacteria bacterium]